MGRGSSSLCGKRPSKTLDLPPKCDRVLRVETAYDKDGMYLGRLADVFGDPTRRNIYRYLRETAQPLSATEVADAFGVHRTVARSHLEKLSEIDLVECGTRRRAGGGRPAKTYVLTAQRLEVMLPPRRYECLARMLLQLVSGTLNAAAAADAARSLGRAYGEQTAALVAGDDTQLAPHLTPRAVVDWMDEAGYSVTLDDSTEGVVVVEVQNCVYRELAQEFPDIVCWFDQAMVCGMLGVDPKTHRRTHALSAGDGFCRHEFRLQER
jgi:predicted ArsR family transcriptional regulator